MTNAVAVLNDRFRQTLATAPDVPGRIVMTHYLSTLPPDVQAAIFQQVRTFNAFTAGNDPHGERDFGGFNIYIPGDRADEFLFWKIDYYESDACEYGAEHPADPAASYRVLTIMLASEY